MGLQRIQSNQNLQNPYRQLGPPLQHPGVQSPIRDPTQDLECPFSPNFRFVVHLGAKLTNIDRQLLSRRLPESVGHAKCVQTFL